MIIVLCEDSKLPHIFPDGVKDCPSFACPADDCTAGGKPGTCVVGLKDGVLTCLGFFPHAVATFSCECTASPCEHMTADHPAMEPLLQRLKDWHEPIEDRTARGKAAVRAQVLGYPLVLPESGEIHTLLTRWAPEVMQHFPLRKLPEGGKET